MKKLIAANEPTVDGFMEALEHPLKKEIEQLRKIVLGANKGLTELIKWNAPSFCLNGEDRITMRIHPPKQVQLIFHRGAKVRELPKEKLISDESGMLVWKTTDRAVATFTSMKDLESRTNDLVLLINKWLDASTTS